MSVVCKRPRDFVWASNFGHENLYSVTLRQAFRTKAQKRYLHSYTVVALVQCSILHRDHLRQDI